MAPEISVLCVDDDADLLELIAAYLERADEDISVQTATTVAEGIQILTSSAIDCIVSDFEMPEFDGLEFLVLVRAEHPSLPFILYTGKGSEEITSKAISAGVSDYMQKQTGIAHYDVLARRIRNLAERAGALERSRETSEQIRAIIDVTPLPVVIRAGGTLVYVNHAAVEFFGAENEDELLGTTAEELLHPEEHEKYRRAATETLQGGPGVSQVRRRYRTVEGDDISAKITGRRIVWEGEDALVGILQPATDEEPPS